MPVGTRFSARPDRPWGPPSLLYNGYRVFPRGKMRPGRAADHSHPSSAEVLEEQSYTSTPLWATTGPVMGLLYLFTLALCEAQYLCRLPTQNTKERISVFSLYSGFIYKYETDVLICDDMITSFQPPSNKMLHNRKATQSQAQFYVFEDSVWVSGVRFRGKLCLGGPRRTRRCRRIHSETFVVTSDCIAVVQRQLSAEGRKTIFFYCENPFLLVQDKRNCIIWFLMNLKTFDILQHIFN